MKSLRSRAGAIADVFSANRDFRIFTAGNSFSLVGVWVQRIAIGWLAWELTRSQFWVGAVAFADLFPSLVVGPFAGVLADRLNRRHILIVCKILTVCQALGLIALVSFDPAIEAVFLVALFGGIVIGIQQPARLAIVPSLVTEKHLAQAVAINGLIFNLARPLGSALAGILVAAIGYISAFVIVALSHLAIVLALMALRFEEEPEGRHRGLFSELAEGARYAATHVAIGPLMLMAMIGALFGRPVFEILPGFADKVFGWGIEGYTILNSAVGVGAVLAGLWMAQRDQGLQGLTRLSFLSLIAFGGFCLAFGLTDSFWFGVVMMALAGSAVLINGAGTQTLIQASVAPNMRGRVLSFWGLTFRGGPALGALVMGALGDYWSIGAPVVLSGAICAAFGLWMYRRRRELAAYLEPTGVKDHAARAWAGSTKS